MKYLKGIEHSKAMKFIERAAEMARDSTCLRSHCGSVIVRQGLVIGQGYNSPPADMESQRRCLCDKKSLDEKVTDKTCCVHAEQRAIMSAIEHNANRVVGARLYFVRLDKKGEIAVSGKPYCTHCSKLALDAGLSEFVLLHKKGICVYDTKEYNQLSFAYGEPHAKG